jgi:hypothetical protein
MTLGAVGDADLMQILAASRESIARSRQVLAGLEDRQK